MLFPPSPPNKKSCMKPYNVLMHLSMSSPTTPSAGNVGGFVGEFHQRIPRGGTGLVIRTFHDLCACAHAYIPFMILKNIVLDSAPSNLSGNSIERLCVTSSPIETNVKFYVKFTSAWQARLAYKCVPYSSHSHSYSSSRISVQTDASSLDLYYCFCV